MGHGPGGDENGTSVSPTSSSGESTISPEVLEADQVYEALAKPRRRYLCYTLLEDTEWSLTDLAMKIAAWEHEIPEHEVTDYQRTQVYVSLYHHHVPKLVEENVIAFDERTETISSAEHTAQVLAALEGIGASLDALQESHARSKIDDSQQ